MTESSQKNRAWWVIGLGLIGIVAGGFDMAAFGIAMAFFFFSGHLIASVFSFFGAAASFGVVLTSAYIDEILTKERERK